MFDRWNRKAMTETANPPKRRPGAPRGNRNAVKTGLHTAEMKDLRRRLRAWRHRANGAIAKANRQIRAERERGRAGSAAAKGEGGRAKIAQN
jgi:hypothetical protein